jgi:hypothetical protein
MFRWLRQLLNKLLLHLMLIGKLLLPRLITVCILFAIIFIMTTYDAWISAVIIGFIILVIFILGSIYLIHSNRKQNILI